MTGYTLKIIAMVTMLIDHITAVFVPSDSPIYLIGRVIGRLAFPIFCFLIVEGQAYTRNIKKYLLRLLIFAFISEIPFDLAFYYPAPIYQYMNHQNIFFTLFIGLLVISIMDYTKKYFAEKYSINNNNTVYFVLENILEIIVLLVGCLIAYFSNVDYSFVGVLMIWAFYMFKDNTKHLTIALILINLVYGFPQVLAVFALYFIKQYNGQRGNQGNKFLFYGFYPIHLTLIFIIKYFVFT